jgi:hypothetical protein
VLEANPSTLGACLKVLTNQILLQRFERFEWDPMDAVNWTGIDGFLNSLGAVAILANGPGATEIGLHHKRIGGDVGAVSAADTNCFINPHSLIS